MLRQNTVFLGIDPGLHGAFVVYDATRNAVIEARIIPTLVLMRNGKKKLTLDIPRLVLIAREIAASHPGLFAFMELVGAHRMHGRAQGGSSMFSFGNTNGATEAAIVAANIPFSKVAPNVWKKALSCPQDKDAALAHATGLIPTSTPFWTPKRGSITKEDCKGVAEAGMIAYYGAHFRASQAVIPIAA